MEQGDQRQRRRGAVDRINTGIDTIRKAQTAIKIARTAGTAAEVVSTSEIWIPIVIVVAVILIFVFIILLGSGGGEANLGNGGHGQNPQPVLSSLASCPVPGGTISTYSYQADQVNGHCSDNYGACDHDSRRAKSIDVPTGGKNVVLPTIEGKSVKWTYVNHSNLETGVDCDPKFKSCGQELVFVNYLENGKNWTLFIGHIGLTGLVPAQSYDSGTIVGSSAIDHVHISIGKDISDPTSFPRGSTDIRPGWLAADINVGMCTTQGTGSNACTQQYEGTGYCSVSNLMPYFGNDPTKTLIASLICEAESGSYPYNLNNTCNPPKVNDYSVGLFQINAVAHCLGAYGNLLCTNLLDEQARDVCENNWYDPANNINFAVSLSNNGVNWEKWSTWSNPGKNPAVKDILTKCGIKY